MKFEIDERAYFINSPKALASEVANAPKNRIEEIVESRITKGVIHEIIINKNGTFYKLKAFNFEGEFTIAERNLKRTEYEAKEHFIHNYKSYDETVNSGYDYDCGKDSK